MTKFAIWVFFALALFVFNVEANAGSCPTNLSSDQIVSQGFRIDYILTNSQKELRDGATEAMFISQGDCSCGIDIPITRTVIASDLRNIKSSQSFGTFLKKYELSSATCPPTHAMISKAFFIWCFSDKSEFCKSKKN